MVSLQSLGLILALYGLGIQAAPSQQAPAVEHHEVSILDLVRNGTVTDSGTVDEAYKHSLPEPNLDDHFEVDGITFYNFPEGGVAVPSDFWDERDISFHNATNSSSLETRQSSITSCGPCKCSYNQQVWYEWQTQNWNTVRSNTHQISDTLCPPGSISKTYTKSYSYQVSVQAGPDLKIGLGVLEKFALRVGYAYTWGKAVATSYGVSWTVPGQQHPFIATFRPNVLVANGIARAHYVDHYYNNKACSVSDWSHMMAAPVVLMSLVFFDTPHHGAGLAKWAEVVSRSIGLVKQTNANIVDVLRRDSEVLARIQDGFYTMVKACSLVEPPAIEVTCFYEELLVLGFGLVVPQDSPILPGYIPIRIHSNHMDMTKFANVDDPGFVTVYGEQRRWIIDTDANKKRHTNPSLSEQVPHPIRHDGADNKPFALVDPVTVPSVAPKHYCTTGRAKLLPSNQSPKLQLGTFDYF
ncbi:uncharacterized protein N7482_004997 [Penicillium canariense]|uniref:Uncharacterized protein n=1 Tax=Penicillium canariense TaxID=189055 RepID=A0A9W9I335_9EURO|nr:uncharacterized protein N7482_004997 [Penicillium canariense]KAJ5166216.1 hypothetical protein N7482_004997 [Penicillium canariense]